MNKGHNFKQDVESNTFPAISIKEYEDSVSVSILDEFELDNVQAVIQALGAIELFILSV